MAVPYQKINLNISDINFKLLIHKYFNDYKTFMNISCLPIPTIEIVNKFADTTVAQTKFPANKTPILQVSKMNSILFQQGMMSVLYHELTHIYDDNICDFKVTHRGFHLTPYTEFHATLVQMMVAMGYDSYLDNKRVSMFDSIHDGSKNTTFEQYILPETNYNTTCLKVDKNDTKRSFNYLYHLLLYYIGKSYFAQKYILEDTTHLFDFSLFIKIFGENIIVLKDLLYLNDNSDNHLVSIAKTQNAIIQEFDLKYNK